MQFLHISDTHLGKRQYNLEFREEDVYETFTQLIDLAIKEHVNAIVHTGDFFDINTPPNKAYVVAIRQLKRLKEAGIPFITIAGDHDSPKRSSAIYPQRILEEYELIKFLVKPDTPYKLDDIYFYGISHVPNINKNRLVDILHNLKPEGKKNVLMLHQGLKEVLHFEGAWQIELGDLPKNFNLYTIGHFHTRTKFILDGGRVVEISGSPDIMREEEIEGYIKLGKGATLIDLSGDMPEIQYINVKIRDQKVITLHTDKVTEEIESLKKILREDDKKPLLHIILEGKSIPKDVLMKKLSLLNEISSYWRIYKDNTKDVKIDKQVELPTNTTIENLILQYLVKVGNFSQEEAKLILEIINHSDDKIFVKEKLYELAGVKNDN